MCLNTITVSGSGFGGQVIEQNPPIVITESPQITISTLEIATQEEKIKITQQFEFDENCKESILQSLEKSVIHLLSVNFWPEFDQSSMLVIYNITLSSIISLPTELNFKIPATAGEPSAVANKDNIGMLISLDYSRRVVGNWAPITFIASTPNIQIEYYDPNLIIDEVSRHFEYQWQNDSLDNLIISVQQPVGSKNIQISPEMYGPGLMSGKNYYCVNLGTETNQYDSMITIDYKIGKTP